MAVHRYIEIAQIISDMISDGSLQPGDPVPSVRHAATQYVVSKGTIIQAYSTLEIRGLIESRPKSGFYVRARRTASIQLPQSGISKPAVVRFDSKRQLRDTLGDLVGSRITSLGTSFPDPALYPLDLLNRSLAASSRKSNFATMIDMQVGLPELRRAIAQRYLELGYKVPMDEIIITCGGMEAISLSLQSLTKPGDLVLIDSPMFFSGLQLIECLGLNVLEMPTTSSQGLDLGVLDETLKKHKVAACLLMTNCHNPVGFSMEEEKKRDLARLLHKHGVPLVENDVYSELQHGLRHVRAAKAFDEHGMVLHCGSFTKCLAPGFKIGWVAAGKFRESLLHRKFATTLGTSAPPQAAIAHYLKHYNYEHHLRSLRTTLIERVGQMSDAVGRLFPDGTRFSRPAGGYVLWVEMPKMVDALELFELASSRQIAVAPGPIFSAHKAYSNFIRLNCTHGWSKSLEETVEWLGKTVEKLARK